MGSLTHVALANANIKDCDIQFSQVKSLEERLQSKRLEIAKKYSRQRNKKKITYYNATTHMALYEGETTEAVSTASSRSGASRDIATRSTGLDQIHGKYHMGSMCI